ncbi:hypothetical protein MJO29_014931 [Puccinia striiformis f. sp. tritici]|uniref:Uncharacterized protein n=1 Tax=Puccinia striiformis f. sp. tritici PST-78 TaxID=1165861 RepID=A0A0L0VWC5_9BASI|nr:hypothetical protein Pst134EA_027997 [Puccinia striiformis f. sp. tritici]KAH9448703.1 hypothetical protein Pst134EA_027997 [Puccinia striiformis f. sp. tritici]KAI7937616.1 hypothetical protein MJO29_014931 [Puccinia striiformis f. sp. tritici]KAI9624845.1 hypothetical protein H4Q26_016620 [Puccinia striiformis f. sp. tritici PST-130]KNF03315.1 hypothetical protein PSTG_03583 [Puccinia striiformis f. sp. tritici PST-78]
MAQGNNSESSEMIREIEGQVKYTGKPSSTENGSTNGVDEEIFHSFTPTSFDLLVPKLKAMVDQVHINFNNLSSISSSSSLVDVSKLLSEWSDLTCSSIILTERELSFYSQDRDRSIIVPYKVISIHGIANGEGMVPNLYCQLDLEEMLESQRRVSGGVEQEREGDDESDEPIELIITPQGENQQTLVEEIFQALSYCASLHPSALPKIEDLDDKEDHHLLDALLSHDTPDQEQPPVDHLAASNRFQPY